MHECAGLCGQIWHSMFPPRSPNSAILAAMSAIFGDLPVRIERREPDGSWRIVARCETLGTALPAYDAQRRAYPSCALRLLDCARIVRSDAGS